MALNMFKSLNVPLVATGVLHTTHSKRKAFKFNNLCQIASFFSHWRSSVSHSR